MKIAVFHHIETGGAKRAVWEHVRALRDRGHTLHLFTPTRQTDAAYLPVAPLCEKTWTYEKGDGAVQTNAPLSASALGGDESRARQTVRRVMGDGVYETVRDGVWVRKQEHVRAALTSVYVRMARDIIAGGYDVLYAHQCGVTLAPPLLRLVQPLPTVFYCQDTLRRYGEWPVDAAEKNATPYDALPHSTILRRKSRWGRVVSPVLAAFGERENERFVHHLRAAPVVLVNSLFSREAFVKSTGVSPRVVYLGVDADFFCPAEPGAATENEINEVLCVGALRPEKRHEFVLDAVATLDVQKRPRVRIVGYGMDAGAQKFAENLMARARAQNVHLIVEREVTDETLRDAYRRARVFAFAPRLEPFGLVVLEALACGTPCVVASEGGPREIVQNGITGFAADPADPAAFGAALSRITGDAALRAQLSQAGRADALSRWTWARSGDVVEAVLGEARKHSP